MARGMSLESALYARRSVHLAMRDVALLISLNAVSDHLVGIQWDCPAPREIYGR
jgi:hypothetical protein